MKAMIFEQIGMPLRLVEIEKPIIKEDEILIKVLACGVCRTELDQLEGRIKPPKLPVILGHQPVGVVEQVGSNVKDFKVGYFAGATWIYSSCGNCKFCLQGKENLCEDFKATGCHENGGYAQYFAISEKYAVKIPESFKEITKAAPLLCGGVVGYRSIKLAEINNGEDIAIWGFGSANHQVYQILRYLYPDSRISIHTRNKDEQILAKKLGADYIYDLDQKLEFKADKAIYTIPVWQVLLKALENLKSGGKIVINLIRMNEDNKDALLNLSYQKHLWLEKEIKTVANITIDDARQFINLASKIPIIPEVQYYKLEEANQALKDLKDGKIMGSKVLLID